MTVCHWTLVTNYVDDAGNSMNILNIGMGGYKYTVSSWKRFTKALTQNVNLHTH